MLAHAATVFWAQIVSTGRGKDRETTPALSNVSLQKLL